MTSAILVSIAFINVIIGFIAIMVSKEALSDVYYISTQVWLAAAILSSKGVN